MRRARASDRGSASVWVLSACALLLTVGVVVEVRTVAVLARHRAEAAADLAALAAAGRIGVADDACRVAAQIAVRNAATVRACSVHLAPDGRSGTAEVTVAATVRLPLAGTREVVANARAARLPASAAAGIEGGEESIAE